MSQRQYTLQLLEDTGYLDSKPMCVPMHPKANLNSSLYRRLVGDFFTLHYLDLTLLLPFTNSLSLSLSLVLHISR